MNNPHPNATASAGGIGLGVLVVWALNKYAKAGLDDVTGAAVAGLFSALVLALGRKGLIGVWQAVKYGNQQKSS